MRLQHRVAEASRSLHGVRERALGLPLAGGEPGGVAERDLELDALALARFAVGECALILARRVGVGADALRLAARLDGELVHGVVEPGLRGVVREARRAAGLLAAAQGLEHAGVQLGPAHRGDRLLDRMADELVPELDRGSRADEDAVGDALVERVRVGARDRAHEVERHLLADDGRDVERAAGRVLSRRVRASAGVADRGGQAAVGRDRLDDQERVAAREADQLARVEPAGLGELAHGGVGQRRGAEAHRRRAGDEVADQQRQLALRFERVVAIGDDEDQRRALDPSGHQAHDVERRAVGPVEVLEHGDDRRACDACAEGARELEAVLAVGGRAGRGGQLAHGRQRDRHRQRLALALPDGRATAQPAFELPHERGLAGAGLAADQDQCAAARGRAPHGIGELRELGLALQHRVHAPIVTAVPRLVGMAFQRGIDGAEPIRPEGLAAGQEEIRRVVHSRHLGDGTFACPHCDAPVAPACCMTPADRVACPYCDHAAPARDFLTLESPTRPWRFGVEVRVVDRRR